MRVVVVESPAKARTLSRYFGTSSTVLPSYGHVRDLPAKNGSVDPERDFAMRWEVTKGAQKNLDQIRKALLKADQLLLATDPDREGEAISWHVLHWLEEKGCLQGKQVQRIVFHEITRKAVEESLSRSRSINGDLVDAYLARRALDYLVGFTLSPLLWRKLPGSRSAGRVQSVALRGICEREDEIEAFRPRDYWTIHADLVHDGTPFRGDLEVLDGTPIEKFSFANAKEADQACALLAKGRYRLAERETRQQKRSPYAPFTTSTLQQSAFNRLGFTAARTMRAAQKLYEGSDQGGGLITYMRTDSTALSTQAVESIRGHIGRHHPREYLPAKPRVYKTKTRNAQEAHEAIRPTDISRKPEDLSLEGDLAALYDLIWRRALASQMESALWERVSLAIADAEDKHRLRAKGSRLLFDGFSKIWSERSEDDSKDVILPAIADGAPIECAGVEPTHHVTQPPPRYSEASLIRRLEELGIGRPSTYASIIGVLKDRQYVRVEKKRFIPEERGRLVTTFLVNFFRRYVEYEFTARMEESLDDVSKGKLRRLRMLKDFWQPFIDTVDATAKLPMREVIDRLDQQLAAHIFGADADEKSRRCPKCSKGSLSLKLGRFGPFLGCSNYPECRYTRPIGTPADGESSQGDDRSLGAHPSGGALSVRRGPYGPYVQWDAAEGKKPKRVSLPRNTNIDDLTREQALDFLSLPRRVTDCPQTGKPIVAGLGRYGPYVGCDGVYASLSGEDSVFTIGANRAVDLIEQARQKKKRRRKPPAKSSPSRRQNSQPES